MAPELHPEATGGGLDDGRRILALVSDLHLGLERPVGGRPAGDPHARSATRPRRASSSCRSDHHPVRGGVDVEHIRGFADGDAEPSALPDRERERPVVFAEHRSVGIDDLAPLRTRAGAVDRTNPPASPLGAKHSSWESGLPGHRQPERSACLRVSAFGCAPTGNSDRASWRWPSLSSMYD